MEVYLVPSLQFCVSCHGYVFILLTINSIDRIISAAVRAAIPDSSRLITVFIIGSMQFGLSFGSES